MQREAILSSGSPNDMVMVLSSIPKVRSGAGPSTLSAASRSQLVLNTKPLGLTELSGQE